MDRTSEESSNLLVEAGSRRRRRSIEEKRRIVEATLAPGASLSLIAREYELNANLLFAWRRLYRQGLLDPAKSEVATPLVPVSVETSDKSSPAARFRKQTLHRERSSGSIEIDFPGGQKLKVTGQVDATVLAQIVSVLSQ